MHSLFTYGTLRNPEVQQELFGRTIAGEDDALGGLRRDFITITDPDVIRISGSNRHPVLRVGTATDSVSGTRLTLTDAELSAADDYEVDDYYRVEVTLVSGYRAWVYASAAEREILQQ
ncbi:gamma-glutamylcyclotransferase family protein [Jongsikchunia kroppenstedtii]|uniref:gamma-glutamylcyclotransferase family protein n=1 Tax=Jongsikchunia kroppenstedtii TaxID=1121721 RepID=UPI0005BA4C11|nr:gamma-glutamylcyclotransferase family protein [Jongsikchunia kroppenstedtii]